MRLEKLLIGTFFFTVFNPFISPVTIETDVQLPVFLFAFILFFVALVNHQIYLSKIEIILLILAFWTMFYIGIEGSFNPRYRLGLPLGLLILLTVKIYLNALSSKVVYVSIIFNAVGSLAHFFVPSLLFLLQNR